MAPEEVDGDTIRFKVRGWVNLIGGPTVILPDAIKPPDELFCPTCNDWRPEEEMARCDACGESYCVSHEHGGTHAG